MLHWMYSKGKFLCHLYTENVDIMFSCKKPSQFIYVATKYQVRCQEVI